ncbi:hypothetical protein ACIA5G_20850 [Amycolatopsis sp. NPDC051758]|uniref:hypothetical protein n=1 Tax=Amycolatopsis sp. NPDC051758 TaxID=3363935 RepID=UPI0037ABF56D
MPPKQQWPCALVAGDLPIMTARHAAILVIMMSLLLGVHLLAEDYRLVLAGLLACAGFSIDFHAGGPLVVVNLRFVALGSGSSR